MHIMLLDRRYYRIYGKNVSIFSFESTRYRTEKANETALGRPAESSYSRRCMRYGKSRDAFFDNIKDRKTGKTTRKVGFPKIKPRHKYNSLTFTQAGYTLEDNRIKINCIDTWFSIHKHREIQGVIKTITIKRDRCGDYWICFSCDNVDDSDPKSMTGNECWI